MTDARPSPEGCEPKTIHNKSTLAIYEFVMGVWLPPSHVTQEHCFEDSVRNIKTGMRQDWKRPCPTSEKRSISLMLSTAAVSEGSS